MHACQSACVLVCSCSWSLAAGEQRAPPNLLELQARHASPPVHEAPQLLLILAPKPDAPLVKQQAEQRQAVEAQAQAGPEEQRRARQQCRAEAGAGVRGRQSQAGERDLPGAPRALLHEWQA